MIWSLSVGKNTEIPKQAFASLERLQSQAELAVLFESCPDTTRTPDIACLRIIWLGDLSAVEQEHTQTLYSTGNKALVRHYSHRIPFILWLSVVIS
jgi:hypothetical protein